MVDMHMKLRKHTVQRHIIRILNEVSSSAVTEEKTLKRVETSNKRLIELRLWKLKDQLIHPKDRLIADYKNFNCLWEGSSFDFGSV